MYLYCMSSKYVRTAWAARALAPGPCPALAVTGEGPCRTAPGGDARRRTTAAKVKNTSLTQESRFRGCDLS